MTGRNCFALACFLFGTQSIAQTQPPIHAPRARLTQADAERIALAQVPDGVVKSAELEREHGHQLWSLDVARPGRMAIVELHIDAISGDVLSTQIETPDKEAAESRAERKRHQ